MEGGEGRVSPSSAGPVVEGRAVGGAEAGLGQVGRRREGGGGRRREGGTDLVSRPEPTVNVLREEVGPVAAVKITEPAGRPEVRNVS